MKDYICATLTPQPCNTDITDLLAAWLGDIGFDSFTPSEHDLKAYILKTDFSASALEAALADFPMPEIEIHTSIELIEGRDWNREWELNYFKPIIIGGECVVHSSFHTDVPCATYDITVDPKMAFGTGHHSTTSLMLEFLLDADLQGKNVIDMGTGTGILAILAKMRGANHVYGIEIDADAADNARENVMLNNAGAEIITGDATALTVIPPANILLANINRNIILNDIIHYSQALLPEGLLATSGFYQSDAQLIIEAAQAVGLKKKEVHTKPDGWTMVLFKKS